MTGLRRTNLILAFLAVLAPMAHVLELPDTLLLHGPLWLAVQQHLYRGWGPFFGAPVQVGALLTAAALLVLRARRHGPWRASLAATAAYAGMIAVFFIFDAPVNAAVSGWTVVSLPDDWPLFRLRWETGHVLAALLGLIAFAVTLRARLDDAAAGRG